MSEYYYFINENIEKEATKEDAKDRGHIIFNSQRESDMGRLENLLTDENKIFVLFDYEEWGPIQSMIYSIKDGTKHIPAGRKYIAAKIFQVLEERYPKLKEYEGSKSLEIFKQGDSSFYLEKENSLCGLDFLEEVLTTEEINIDRIHFIVRSIGSPVLFNSLSMLLSDNTPFKVSIYISEASFPYRDLHSSDERWYSEIYSYTSYTRGKDGEPSIRKRTSDRKRKR